jgi:hypothetical protein
MTKLVYPALPGLRFPMQRSPVWESDRFDTTSGRVFTCTQASSPRYLIRLAYEVLQNYDGLRDADVLVGFFNRVRGDGKNWVFDDPTDNVALNEQFAIADGVTKDFQLVRTRGGFADPIYELNGAPTIKQNGTTVTPTLAAGLGQVSFATAPTAGSVLTWSGGYYWLCRFTKRQIDFEQFLRDFWSAGQVEFKTERP